MPYCPNCGMEVNENQDICLNCGVSLKKNTTSQNKVASNDSSFLWGLLGFFIPVAGLIIFLVWKNERPVAAKGAGIGALISVCSLVLLRIIIAIAFL